LKDFQELVDQQCPKRMSTTAVGKIKWISVTSANVFTALIGLAAIAGVGAAAQSKAAPPDVDLTHRVQNLLSAYASNDQVAVLAMLDTKNLTIYGSDLAEFVKNASEFKQMMDDDFALWHTATFGPIQDLSVRVNAGFATAFFNVSFSAGGGAPVPVRLATVWHRVHGSWLLTQCATTVPTVGSSAAELLHRTTK
jgi:uncharacterized protein with beta-barrel porin domain